MLAAAENGRKFINPRAGGLRYLHMNADSQKPLPAAFNKALLKPAAWMVLLSMFVRVAHLSATQLSVQACVADR
jgi:hypothetical protein